jgi:hypothetical protein
MANYSASSPWHNTRITNFGNLDILKIRPIPTSSDDAIYEVQPQYTHRPDLLAYDYYGSSKLWWVFAQRNIEVLKDPVYDLVPGLTIYLPNPDNVKKALGI